LTDAVFNTTRYCIDIRSELSTLSITRTVFSTPFVSDEKDFNRA